MLKIYNEVVKKQKNFWNGCVFHPTDAVEDPWGKRILDKMSEDGAINNVRIYAMFEDIVYLDGEDNLCFDFRVSDLRLDYLVSKGFDLLIAYAGMPECIARNFSTGVIAAKNKTRYKGKMWNTSPPISQEIWEEVCYQYTKHNVERYGIEVVSKWRCHCFNESDISMFFMADLPWGEDSTLVRAKEYCQMYEGFVKGVRRACSEIAIGGPALASDETFFEYFLNNVKEKKLPLDFISLHYYGAEPYELNEGLKEFGVSNLLDKHKSRLAVVKKCGFEDTPIIIDEWGACSHGFFNKEECPMLMFRETEQYPAYYTRLIHDIVYSDMKMDALMICLSGQHEMTEDFSGFRNFFTLNFIKKPIYNAYILASKLGEDLLKYSCENPHVYALPTKTEKGYAVMFTYAADNFNTTLADAQETLCFEGDIAGKKMTVWAIDKTYTNPYALYQNMGMGTPTKAELTLLREEGILKPVYQGEAKAEVVFPLTANATYFVMVE